MRIQKQKTHTHSLVKPKYWTKDPIIKSNKWFALSVVFQSVIIVTLIISFIEKLLWWTPSDGITKFWIMFTNLSGIYVAIMSCLVLGWSIYLKHKNKGMLPNWIRLAKFGAVVAITLTMIGYWIGVIGILLTNEDPVAKASVWCFHNFGRHLIIPVIAIVDFFLFDYVIEISWKTVWVALAFPILYVLAQIAVYYSTGVYPYFCLNYGSKTGWFGWNFNFKTQPLNFMGSFYWIILAAGLVSCFAMLYKYLIEKAQKKQIIKKAK